MSDMSTVTVSRSVFPGSTPCSTHLLRDASREHALKAFALLLAVDDHLVQQAQTLERSLRAGAGLLRELEEELLDIGRDRRRGWCAVKPRSP